MSVPPLPGPTLRGRTPPGSLLHDRSARESLRSSPSPPCTLCCDGGQNSFLNRPAQHLRARRYAPRSATSPEPQRNRRASRLSAQRATAPVSVDLALHGPSNAAVVHADSAVNGSSNGGQPRAKGATLLSKQQQPAGFLDQPTARNGLDDAHASTSTRSCAAELDTISAVGCTAQLAGTHEAGFEARGDGHPQSASVDEQPAESGFLPANDLAAIQTGAEQPPPAAGSRWLRRRGGGDDGAGGGDGSLEDQPTESGVLPEDRLTAVRSELEAAPLAAGLAAAAQSPGIGATLFHPQEQSQIRDSWRKIMRWSREFKGRGERNQEQSVLQRTQKVVVFGGGSFGTAVGTAIARQKADLAVSLLLRDPYICKAINETHRNTRYLADHEMPANVTATTSMAAAIAGAQYAVHAVPVQHSRAFLHSIRAFLPPNVPIICVSKGLEVGTGAMMSELIPEALGRKQPAVFLSGPSFAKEVMDQCPTGVVAACKDAKLAREVQELLAGPSMRVNTTQDVIGVEICGALKNVLAIAAGIVEGLDLGNNAMAALLTQGCSEIRWLAEKMGARPETVSGLSGLGDIMLTCYGALSRNRSVGVRLGRGEPLSQIIASSSQVAEGVSTAGVVVGLGKRHRVALPVLTAVAQVLDGNLSARQAVWEIMNLPQISEM